MASNVKFLRQNCYYQTLEVFSKLSTERKANLACLRQNIPTALRKLRLGVDKQRFSVLSIGAGDGVMDRQILNVVEEDYLNEDRQFQNVEIFNTGVEPMHSYAKNYKEAFENQHDVFASVKRSVKFEFKPMSFEEYVNTKHDRNQYDLIQAIHSLYFVDSLESSLNHCYQYELGDKGLIVCILLAQGSVINQFTKISKRNRSADDNTKDFWRITDEIVSVAEANHWEFTRHHCPFSYDVTQILKETTEEGKLLLDFLTFETHFLETADKESVDNVCKLLEDMSTEDEDGRMMVNEVNELILIYKTSQ